MHKYDPQLSPERQDLFNKIKKSSYDIAVSNDSEIVSRDMSLYALIKTNPTVINKMKKHGVKKPYIFIMNLPFNMMRFVL